MLNMIKGEIQMKIVLYIIAVALLVILSMWSYASKGIMFTILDGMRGTVGIG